MIKQQSAVEEDLPVDENVDENETYFNYEIASYPSDLTLSGVREMWGDGNKDIIIPDFQRNFVWTIKQASLLIESFLLGLPVPQIFFYVDEHNKNEVIDGQQRILSVVYYLDGFFGSENLQGKKQVFRLQGLDEKSPYAGKRFEDLDEEQKRRLKYAVLRAINIKQLQPTKDKTCVYHIFERLNTGGTPLRPQEIRNCVFRGELVTVLRELNKDANWRLIIGKRSYDKHQKDVELVLRMFGMAYKFDNYDKPMKDFLNRTMDAERDGKSPAVRKFKISFPQVCKIIVEKLGQKPFHVRGPLNSSALDSVFCTILKNIDKLPEDLSERFRSLLGDGDYTQTTYYSTSDLVVVKLRFEKAYEYLIA